MDDEEIDALLEKLSEAIIVDPTHPIAQLCSDASTAIISLAKERDEAMNKHDPAGMDHLEEAVTQAKRAKHYYDALYEIACDPGLEPIDECHDVLVSTAEEALKYEAINHD